MKRWMVAPALLLLAGCWNSEAPDNRAAGTPTPTPTATPSALDRQAAQQSNLLWNRLLTRCGDRIFTAGYVTGWSAGVPGVSAAPDRYGSVAEFNSPSWKAVPETLSKADELNGLEWRGLTVLYAEAVREKFALQDDFGLWRTPVTDIPDEPKGIYAVVLSKTADGGWLFNNRPLDAIEPVKVDCANPIEFPPPVEPGAEETADG